MPEAKEFAHSVTLDHIILGKEEEDSSRNGDRVAAVVFDLYTKWLLAYPDKTKESGPTRKAIRRFLGAQTHPTYIYSGNSGEIIRAIKDLGYEDRHDTSTPNRPATNGIVERMVRVIKEGTSAALLQAGANPEWWSDAMRTFTFLHNCVDKLADGETPYQKRFKNKFQGPIIPFGCEVEYKPVWDKTTARHIYRLLPRRRRPLAPIKWGPTRSGLGRH